jgi:hypothetical protein
MYEHDCFKYKINIKTGVSDPDPHGTRTYFALSSSPGMFYTIIPTTKKFELSMTSKTDQDPDPHGSYGSAMLWLPRFRSALK